MNKTLLERNIAILSIFFAVIHFTLETLWHLKYGQFLPMLIVDYIAVSLLLFGGIRSLQRGNAAGLLCGAWGFAFCLNYRALFWRVDALIKGDTSLQSIVYLLSAALLISFGMFVLTLYLANPKPSTQ